MISIFPTIESDAQFRAWRRDAAQWMPVVAAIAAREGIRFDAATPFSTGTNVVVALNDGLVLKVYPPRYRHQHVSEVASLKVLAGRLHVSIPEIVAEGEVEGWPYLFMSRLSGIVGSEVWAGLSEDQKLGVLGQVGEVIAAVQAVPPGMLDFIEPSWPDLVTRQIAACHARHAAQGLPAPLLADLDRLLETAGEIIPTDGPRVILTGEYIPENFLLSEDRGQWRIAGLFDFGDVMTGFHEYDLLGPSAFMSAGHPARVRSLLQGYGYKDAKIDGERRRRLFLLMLIHRASDLRNVAIDNWQARISRLDELEKLIWPSL